MNLLAAIPVIVFFISLGWTGIEDYKAQKIAAEIESARLANIRRDTADKKAERIAQAMKRGAELVAYDRIKEAK